MDFLIQHYFYYYSSVYVENLVCHAFMQFLGPLSV